MNVQHYHVRHDHEWGEFFVREHPQHELHGSSRHAATWSCVTSYGTFGCWWSHMGEPFAEFIKNLDGDYLLSKISKKEFNDKVCLASLRKEITQAHDDEVITEDEKEDAFLAISEIECDHSGEGMAAMLWDDSRLDCVGIDWTDLPTQAWPSDAEQFVKKLWPEFVKAVVERSQLEQVNA